MSYIGASPTTSAFVTDTFNGNGSTVAFTMSVAPANTTSIIVAVSGVLQDPSTYSVSGTTLTFSAAPPSGTGNISVRFLGIPASGVTSTAYRTQTEFTATAGQTTFSVPSYTVGYIDVYRNGVLLGSADFTATSGTTVVLTNPASSGDLVETVSFYVSSVLNAIPAVANAVTTSYINGGAVTTAKINDGAVTTAKIADANITPAKLSQPLTLGTAVASTSGTSIDFTGIPSWVKRITVMFDGVSTNGSSGWILQIGAGSVDATSYTSHAVYTGVSTGGSSATTGYVIVPALAGVGTNIYTGTNVLTIISSNTWVQSNAASLAQGAQLFAIIGAGSKTLSGTLDRIRITTINGTDTFDAGSINILYE